MSKKLQSYLAFLLFLLIVPLFEAFEALDKFEEKLGLKKPHKGEEEDKVRHESKIIITHDGPVVQDATISFRAEHFYYDYEPPFFYSWSDDASPRHLLEVTSDEKVSHWNITYSSKADYEPREYRCTVMLYNQGFWGRDYIGETTVSYKVTRDLNGKLEFSQKIPSRGQDRNMIRTTEDTELSVSLHDPSHFLDGATMQFYWFVNKTNYGLTDKNSFAYRFAPAGRFDVELILIAHVSGDGGKDGNQTTAVVNPVLKNNEDPRNMTTQQLQRKVKEAKKVVPPFLKTGIFQMTLESRNPISNYNYTGKTWINSGRLVRLNTTCDGSGPWASCWGAKPVPYNITGKETCKDDGMTQLDTKMDRCFFPVFWYFREPGMHNLITIVQNEVSMESSLVLVNMYNSTVEPPLSVVIIPVTCSLISIFGIGFGFFTFFICRRNDAVETADFDFNSREEQLEIKTFWERLRDSMLNAFSNSSDDVSHVSSVSSRSIQNPITSIHYGSIS